MTVPSTTGIKNSPAEQGFRMPGPGHPHLRTWMAWPHRSDLLEDDLPDTQRAYAEVARAISRFEPVIMVVHPAHVASARKLLDPKVDVVAMPIDDAWIRDSGPTFLISDDGRLGGVSWRFNAWGGKHEPWQADDELAPRVLAYAGAQMAESFLVCEGGSLTTDGDGTLICTETSILNPNRNPGVSKGWAEIELKRMLGVEKVVWLPGDPLDSETDGHIDGMCCFIGPGKVLFEVNPDPYDPHGRILADNLFALKAQTTARGREFEVLPIEEAVDAKATSDIFCRSYINFYIANGGIVLPSYGMSSDERALDSIRTAFPDAVIEQVDVNAIAPGGGSIHCITQEQPLPLD